MIGFRIFVDLFIFFFVKHLGVAAETECDNPDLLTTNSSVILNKRVVHRQHPQIINVQGEKSEACAAKFISLSSRSLDIWWDDGAQGIAQGRLNPGRETTSNSYSGHVFYFTERFNKANVVAREIIECGKPLYPIYDKTHPGDSDVIAKVKREEAFNNKYYNRTGTRWRHFYGDDGPRPPPTLYMWPAPQIGTVHAVTSRNGFWNCDGTAEACLSREPLLLELECVSLTPRVFILDKFLSEFEADYIISIASSRVAPSRVGNTDGGGVLASSTRTSRNTWIPRSKSAITETIARRVADALQIPQDLLHTHANAEDMQVVHYTLNQQYESHHDWGVSGYPNSRYITMLFYLTDQLDSDAGGETAFPKGGPEGGFKVRPVKGSAVAFYNLLEDGNGDDLALHAALPVLKGEKWLSNYWIWDPKRR